RSGEVVAPKLAAQEIADQDGEVAEETVAAPVGGSQPIGTPAVALSRATNDPRARPKPVAQLEVISTQSEVAASGFIDTTQPTPVSGEGSQVTRAANDPRRARAQTLDEGAG